MFVLCVLNDFLWKSQREMLLAIGAQLTNAFVPWQVSFELDTLSSGSSGDTLCLTHIGACKWLAILQPIKISTEAICSSFFKYTCLSSVIIGLFWLIIMLLTDTWLSFCLSHSIIYEMSQWHKNVNALSFCSSYLYFGGLMQVLLYKPIGFPAWLINKNI